MIPSRLCSKYCHHRLLEHVCDALFYSLECFRKDSDLVYSFWLQRENGKALDF